jgi:hypothetical protein
LVKEEELQLLWEIVGEYGVSESHSLSLSLFLLAYKDINTLSLFTHPPPPQTLYTHTNRFVDMNAPRGTEEGLFMTDCVECRPGMFSPVFADLIGTMKTNIKFFGVLQTITHTKTKITSTKTNFFIFKKKM